MNTHYKDLRLIFNREALEVHKHTENNGIFGDSFGVSTFNNAGIIAKSERIVEKTKLEKLSPLLAILKTFELFNKFIKAMNDDISYKN